MKIEIAKRIVTVVATMLLFVAAISHAQSGWSGMTIGSGGKDLNAVYFADSKRGWVGGDDGIRQGSLLKGQTHADSKQARKNMSRSAVTLQMEILT